ncbi:chromosome partition protein Smc [Haloferula sargassicola]|uniref:Chromosome partition protein Smc n=1 Tax=Haloferula sargassicola TaxID=490096 RepID=A0ABP9UQA9_9BACT
MLNGPAQEKITYDDHIFPLFQQSCLNCHNPDKTKGGLDLSSYQGAMKGGSGGKVAEVGDTGSKLLTAVMQTAEPKMPPEGDKLGDDKIGLIKAWIEGGLLENKSSTAKKPDKPKFDLSMSADPAAKPEGPPPMPEHVLLEPAVVTDRAPVVRAMAASPWAPLLAMTGERQVLLFDTTSLVLAGVLPFPEGDPVSLAFTPNGRYLIVGGGVPGKSGLTVTFDVTTGERMLTAGKEFDTILACDLRPDLATVATGSPSRKIKLWKTDDGSQLASIKKHTDWVTALDFSPDGVLLATGDRNGGVWVWEAQSGNEFHTLRAHQAGITATAFRADSNVLATAAEDGSVRFWEMNNGGEIKKIDAHPGGVLGFSWARDGSFATCGRDGKAKLWKPDFNHLRDIGDLPDLPVGVALDAEGKRVFIATYSGQVVVHDVASGERVGELDANPPHLKERLASLRAKIAAHPGELAEATRLRDEAAEKFEAARERISEAEKALAETKSTIELSEKSKADSLAARDRTQGELNGKNQERQQAVDGLANLEARLEQRKSARAELDGELEGLRQQVAAGVSQIAQLRQQPDGPEKELQLTDAEARQASIEKQLAETTGRQRDALDQESSVAAQCQDARDRLTSIDEQVRALSMSLEGQAGKLQELDQTIQAAQARVPDLEKQIAAHRGSATEAEKELATAEQRVSAKTTELAGLKREEHHWSSAEINWRALEKNREAEAAAWEAEGRTTEYAEIQKSFDGIAAALADARQGEPSEELAQEIARRESALAEAEKKVVAARARLDQALATADRLKAEAQQLQDEYFRSLKAETTS